MIQSWLQFLSVPTAEGPGTVLLLSAGQKRYMIGRLSEGTLRKVQQGQTGLGQISDVLLTGRLKWDNMGGLCGIALLLAETKAAAKAARAEMSAKKNVAPVDDIRMHGQTNLTYAFATMRRFIFRTGIPLEVNEISHSEGDQKKPTWEDESIRVWAMPVFPNGSKTSTRATTPTGHSRKRSFSQSQDRPVSPSGSYKSVVKDMFASNWSARQLVSMPLKDVEMPAAVFIKNGDTGAVEQYSGPLPGGKDPIPNIEVLVRLPWPGARVTSVQPATESLEALSYIISHHPQRGKFLPLKAKEHGIQPGELFAELSAGRSVQNGDGMTVTPEMVMEPGRAGRSIAVLDIPSEEYIEPLLARPEMNDGNLLASFDTVVWILDPGLKDHTLIRQFQQAHSSAKHIVSSTDASPDTCAFKQAVEVGWLRNFIDSDTFPGVLPHESSGSFLPTVEAASIEEDAAKNGLNRAQFGLRRHIEPKPRFDFKCLETPLDLGEQKRLIQKDAKNCGVDIVETSAKLDVQEAKSWLSTINGPEAQVITLGTGSGTPCLLRNVAGNLIRVPGQGSYLLDCGEGTLGTLRRMYPPSEVEEILRDLRMIWISHLHADHHLGLTSVLKEWSRVVHGGRHAGNGQPSRRRLPVVSHSHMLQWLEEFSYIDDMGYSNIIPLKITPPQFTNDISDQDIPAPKLESLSPQDTPPIPRDEYLDMMNLSDLSCVYVNHCFGAMAMSATTKSGFKFSFSGDCRPSMPFAAIGRGSDVLIHEATFADQMIGEAKAKKHSTAGEALIVADNMQAKALVLTHLSQRYYNSSSLAYSVEDDAAKPSSEVSRSTTAEETLQTTSTNGEDVPTEEDTNRVASETTLRPTTAITETSHSPVKRSPNALEIRRILNTTPLKVVTAYDYMTLKMKDVPRIQNLQPVFTQFDKAWDDLTCRSKSIPDQQPDAKKSESNGANASKAQTGAKRHKKQKSKGEIANGDARVESKPVASQVGGQMETVVADVQQ